MSPCRACAEGRRRRRERLEKLRQHHAEREAKRQELNRQNINSKIRYLDNNGEES